MKNESSSFPPFFICHGRRFADLSSALSAFVRKGIAVDLEIHPENTQLRKLGTVHLGGEGTLEYKGAFDAGRALDDVSRHARTCRYILGHNIFVHDLVWVTSHFPDTFFSSLPGIDILIFSPLAFPKNPYHHLVKDYKLVRESVNDPVRDCMQTILLFQDELMAFKEMSADLCGFYGAVLDRSFPGQGYGPLFTALLGAGLPDDWACSRIWMEESRGHSCGHQAEIIFMDMWNRPEKTSTLAYMLAWLRVAGGSSLVPAWVWHRYPEIPEMLSRLRSIPCGRATCSYCRTHGSIRKNLQMYFGFDDFLPVADEDPPLQEQVVTALVQQKDCLAVLPTGAGKSLCYLLPALMHSARRNTLTLIISPLQSLMKDQVDGLVRKGILKGCTINGSLTMLERSRTLDAVRLGDRDLVWLAPEQFRNQTVKDVLKQREIGMIIMDEAHCFSKWGHDFRPDYLVLSKFLTEIWPGPPCPRPQIGCFTATAKPEVIQEILEYFRTEMDRKMVVFEGGHERSNLKFEVIPCAKRAKVECINGILQDVLSHPKRGGAIVFVPTRAQAQHYAEALGDLDWQCDFYHAGRTPEEKRRVQDGFLAGKIRVMVATNAFGMGVDKPDVRVVIHAAVPGSLENYFQEAGRAGRDREPALCCLLYDREDLETQFERCCMAQLSHRDIRAMLTGLKRIARTRPDHTVIMTSGELLLSRELENAAFDTLDARETLADTKVRTALSWLERTGKIIRGNNHTQVVQGTVLVRDREEAVRKIIALKLPAAQRDIWIALLDILLQADPKGLITTDFLAAEVGEEPTRLLKILHSMRRVGIINHDLNMTCLVRKGIADNSLQRLGSYGALEEAVLGIMEEDEPDAVRHTRYVFPMRAVSQRIRDRGVEEAGPPRILDVLELLIEEKMIRLAHRSQASYSVILRKNWEEIRGHVRERSQRARVILNFLLDRVAAGVKGKDLLVSFQSGELERALRGDLVTVSMANLYEGARTGLLALHQMKVISLQNGLAVIRPAMTLTVSEPGVSFSVRDFFSLALFYKEKIAQVHIMGKYAEMGAPGDGIRRALRMVRDYFSKERAAFLSTYFKGQETTLELPVSEEGHRAIVQQLNPAQKKVVETGDGRNLLVVAGPGSGKTRVIIHRIGWLVKVKRVRPDRILVLAFNRNAIAELRKRLVALLGKTGRRVRIQTYHSLALSITGRSLMGRSGGENVFVGIIKEAVTSLKESREAGQEGVGDWRDKVLGLEHILVDEYQDINEDEYALLSLLAGRNEEEQGRRPTLLAVGDADQNIYAFQGSNVRFIRMFAKDYNASLIYMNRNYRSLAPIIRAADRLIGHNQDRMESPPGKPVRREKGSPVHVICTPCGEAVFKVALLRARACIDVHGYAPEDICILCRTNQEVFGVTCLARKMGLKVFAMRSRRLPFPCIREVQEILDILAICRKSCCSGKDVRELVDMLVEESDAQSRIWLVCLQTMAADYEEEWGRMKQPVQVFIDMVFELSRDFGRFGMETGAGIRVTTMHSVKGMEFPVVVVSGYPLSGGSLEEERRLYYVGMTRAKDRLECVCGPREHLFIPEILSAGPEYVTREDVVVGLDPGEMRACTHRLWEMEPDDLVLSFPAFKDVSSRTMSMIDSLGRSPTRQKFAVKVRGSGFMIVADTVPVALLSRKGAGIFRTYLDQGYTVAGIILLAQILRTPSESDLAGDTVDTDLFSFWYVPLFQMVMGREQGV